MHLVYLPEFSVLPIPTVFKSPNSKIPLKLKATLSPYKTKNNHLHTSKLQWHRENIPLPKEKNRRQYGARPKPRRENIKSCGFVSNIQGTGVM
jgi:hypothetical protein